MYIGSSYSGTSINGPSQGADRHKTVYGILFCFMFNGFSPRTQATKKYTNTVLV